MLIQGFQEFRRMTFDKVAKQTGINRPTLSKIDNQLGFNSTTDNLNALCRIFGLNLGEGFCPRFCPTFADISG